MSTARAVKVVGIRMILLSSLAAASVARTAVGKTSLSFARVCNLNCRSSQTATYLRLFASLSSWKMTGRPAADPQTLFQSPDELDRHVEALHCWWKTKSRVLCLTGAGLSTEAGIPDYRGHRGSYTTSNHKPMVHDQFMKSVAQRKRYWGRSMVGWKVFHEREPAIGHFALARLERLGRLGVSWSDGDTDKLCHRQLTDLTSEAHNQHPNLLQQQHHLLSIITQNVDSLHRRAGSCHVLELHGRNDRLTCMNCGNNRDRQSYQNELARVNADWLEKIASSLISTESGPSSSRPTATRLRPDGDATIGTDNFDAVRVPHCDRCNLGFFKPDVVFFGDNVPGDRVQQCKAAIEACDGLVVVGSSLTVHSAFRHVRAAHERATPIAILNVGETRAEAEGLTALKIEAPAGPTLQALVQRMERE